MADFFGGILDDLSGYADDVHSFFETTTAQALAKAVKAGYAKNTPTNQSRGATMGTEGLSSPGNTKAITSEDFSDTELRWLARMKTFANLDTGTNVKLK